MNESLTKKYLEMETRYAGTAWSSLLRCEFQVDPKYPTESSDVIYVLILKIKELEEKIEALNKKRKNGKTI